VELRRLGREVGDSVPAERGQVRVRLGRGADEEREDEVVELEPRLADERAQPVAAAQPAEPRGGKAHSRSRRRQSRRLRSLLSSVEPTLMPTIYALPGGRERRR